MKNLFVEFLNTNNRERQKEYDDTLSINNQLNYFDNIYIIKGKDVVVMQTIEKINPDPSKTVIFALPVEVLEGIKALGQTFKK